MRFLYGFIFLLFTTVSWSQENVTTFGIQFKPMIPSKSFGTGSSLIVEENIEFTLTPKFGNNFGMLIRKGLTKNWSLETGISMVKRNFTLESYDPDYDARLQTEYSFVSYEIPVQALYYIRLGENFWMNASGGVSLDFYPSNIYSNAFFDRDTLNFQIEQSTNRVNWMQLALVTNLGFEYRTKDKGYFYIGGSFHQQFIRDMAIVAMRYSLEGNKTSTDFPVQSNYLTVDLRYFFNEKPEKRRR